MIAPFAMFTAVYIFLGVILVFLLRRQFLETAPGRIDKVVPDHA